MQEISNLTVSLAFVAYLNRGWGHEMMMYACLSYLDRRSSVLGTALRIDMGMPTYLPSKSKASLPACLLVWSADSGAFYYCYLVLEY